jgi:hypothetical protein
MFGTSTDIDLLWNGFVINGAVYRTKLGTFRAPFIDPEFSIRKTSHDRNKSIVL